MKTIDVAARPIRTALPTCHSEGTKVVRGDQREEALVPARPTAGRGGAITPSHLTLLPHSSRQIRSSASPKRGAVMHLGSAPIAAGAVAQASRTANCPLVPALDTTWSLRDSTNSGNVVNPSDFSLKAGSIRCIWLLTPAA